MPKFTAQREQEIRYLLDQLEISGKSVAEFADAHGVAPWTVYSWRKRFLSPSPSPSRRRDARVTHADLVEVRRQPGPAPSFEIVIREVVVRVPPGFDDQELARVVQAIRSC